jgi:hypothetical protein
MLKRNKFCISGAPNGSITGHEIHFAPNTRMIVKIKMMADRGCRCITWDPEHDVDMVCLTFTKF